MQALRRPGQANGSRECAPDDRLRASRDPSPPTLVLGEAGATADSNDTHLWLWVPAFAGTTSRASHCRLPPHFPIQFSNSRGGMRLR
jgi:hypothetical protein